MQSLQLTAWILVVRAQNSAILYHYFKPAESSAIFGEHGEGFLNLDLLCCKHEQQWMDLIFA